VLVCGYSSYQLRYQKEILLINKSGAYKVDTGRGQSGSPVFLSSDVKDIVGIHKGYDAKNNRNVCTLIT
jgi:V8-like Glu-specific endopeptidase